jgi:isocitrate dehydrogenase (NAD+)
MSSTAGSSAVLRASLIEGDGVGPEIAEATLQAIEASGARFQWEPVLAGERAVARDQDPLPQATLDSIGENRIALKGPCATPKGVGFRSVNVALRQHFDLFANLRPVRTLAGVPSRYEKVDIVLVRENTEDLYAGVEHYVDARRSAAESIAIITRHGSERVIRYAFEFARKHGRRKVTLVHKANILKYTQGLFLEEGRRVAEEYADRIPFEDRIVDATAMHLVLDPYQFDVLVMENMFGDILSDQMAGLVGGLGMAPGGNIGRDAAIFEPVHGSAPDLAGKGIANPTAMILAACMMLDHIEQSAVAARIRTALEATLHARDSLTPDLGGSRGTDAFANAILSRL